MFEPPKRSESLVAERSDISGPSLFRAQKSAGDEQSHSRAS